MSARTWNDGEAGGTPITAAALNDLEADVAASVKQWQADTTYAIGDQVINPAGDVVTAVANHISGDEYTASSNAWALSTSFEQNLGAGGITTFLRGDREWATIDLAGGGGGDGEAFEHAPLATQISGPVGAKLTIPTHVSPGGGETTHPSVVFVPEGWGVGGYKYWMAHTPYPGGNDDHEDPNIAASHDGITWEVPEGLLNPIDDVDGTPEYNSDTELVLGPNETMYLFWRHYDSGAAGAEESLWYSTSTDGISWTLKTRFYVSAATALRMVSPTLIFEDNRWVMWAVDIVPSPNRVVRLETTGPDLDLWSEPVTVSVGAMQTGKEAWHLAIIKHAGRYVGLLNDCTTDQSGANGDLLFIVSADGKTFTNSGTTVIPKVQTGLHDKLYRATLVPAVEKGVLGYRVWYSAWNGTSPAVWNVFRTFIGAPSAAVLPATANGQFTTAGIAAGGFLSVAVTFPAGRFTTAPWVNLTTDNTRCNLARSAVTKDGFNFLIQNWTSGSVGSTALFYWKAEAL